ncbi:MAG: FtsW/RodA/SpoVE family cell cycle protein [Clostridia bacterium]|nr:FtsW/RodA/SpoVE family cell cycle protein [Clostridia bacterium]
MNEYPIKNPSHARRDPDAMNRASGANPSGRPSGTRSSAGRPAAQQAPARQGETRRMNGNPNPATPVRQTHAVRSPDQTGAVRQNGSRVSSGTSRNRTANTRSLTPSEPSDLVAAYEERRLARREAREEKKLLKKEERAEAQVEKWEKQDQAENVWQRDIVRVRSGIDRPLLVLALVLLALGSITVLSASYPLAVRRGMDDAAFYANKQLRSALLGLATMAVGFFIPYEKKGWRRFFPIVSFALASVLLIAVFFMGISAGEAQRWIVVPFIGFTIQPSEIMKPAIVMMLALYADVFRKKREESITTGGMFTYNVLVPTMILGVACGLVIIGKHLSGTMIIGAIGFFMILMMVDRKCPRWWAPVTIILLLAAAATLFILFVPYARTRFMGIVNPGADVKKDSWQSIQSLYAVGSGGIFGVGVAQSRQKYAYLAAAHTDFIFAIWCEEFGFLGAVALIALFLAFLWRGFRIAARARDKFTMLTAYGITTHLAIQMIGHMIVDTTYINTGISLPFFSYGGSSLLVQMFEVGMLLRISQHFYRSREDLERDALRKRAGLD